MVSLILWFVFLSSGSVLCAAVWGKKYEEALPVTCSALVLLLFLFGIAGILKTGVLFVCFLGAAIYIFSSIYIFHNKCHSIFLEKFFTPGFFVFFILFLAACCLNIGKMAENWDEFSHWIDIVKVMATLDDFGTHPGSGSAFMSYPPGMTLFQYFLQKLYVWTSNAIFSEWRVYVAFQMFVFSFMLPCIKFDWKKPISIVCSVMGMCLCPLLLYEDFYTSTYIDAVIGILSGAGFAAVFFNKKRDILYSLRILSTCLMLVLLKDAGLMFAVLLAAFYVADMFLAYSQKGGNGKYFCIPAGILAVVVPKFLWGIHLSAKNAVMKFSSFNLKMFWDVLVGQDSSYRSTVVKNYYEALLTRNIKRGSTGVSFNYLALTVLLFFLIYLTKNHYKKQDGFYQKKGEMLVFGLAVQFFVYVVGLCATYVSNFGEYEAVRLASFERYINIVYLSGCVVLLFLALGLFQRMAKKTCKQLAVLLAATIMVIPLKSVYEYVSRATVERSIAVRAPYVALSSVILDTVPKGSKIYLISQGTTGFDYWVLKYAVRPYHVNPSQNPTFTWSIGVPFYEGDIWTRSITPQEWQAELLLDYDYVALYKINNYFLQNFGGLFQDPAAIRENTVFRINKETGLLEFYGEVG